MKQITYDELAEFLFANKGYDTEISFCEKADNGEESWYCAATTVFVDAPMAIINYYGGGCPFVYDFSEFDDMATLKMALKAYFKHYAIEEVFVEEKEFNDAYRGWISVNERYPETDGPYEVKTIDIDFKCEKRSRLA